MDILNIAKRKLDIISKNKKLTEEEKEMYFEIFVDDIIQNTAYTRRLLWKNLFCNKINCI